MRRANVIAGVCLVTALAIGAVLIQGAGQARPLRGRITDAASSLPITQAQVTAGDTTVVSDHDGRYQFTAIFPSALITASAPGYLTAQKSQAFAVNQGDMAELNLTLPPNIVPGRLHEVGSDQPIPRAEVTWDGGATRTDAAGRFVLQRLRPGTLLTFQAPGYLPSAITFTDQAVLDVGLKAKTTTVTVTDAFTGQPLPRIQIVVGTTTHATDDKGMLVLRDVPAGTRLVASAPDYAATQVVLQGEATLEVALRPNVLAGKVLDATTGQVLPGALIYVRDSISRVNEEGAYRLQDLPPDPVLRVKVPGYRLTQVRVGKTTHLDIRLTPFHAKGLYIPFHVLRDEAQVRALFDLVDRTELNAVVVDVKGDKGRLAYPSQVPLAQQIGAYQAGMMDLREFLRLAREKNIYTIARLVIFKDNPLAQARPDLAVKRADGTLWTDLEGLAWTNPFRREVWDYNIAIAKQVAALGFDEINLDYIRFPSDGDMGSIVYAELNTPATRTKTIREFMAALQDALKPYGVFISADLFGMTAWVKHDMGIGQRLDDVAPYVDYLAPMLYPSTFGSGNLGYENPSARPYDVVYRSLIEAMKRTKTKIRPWLQHYSRHGVEYTPALIEAQKKAAADAGTYGWTFWNGGGEYNPQSFALEK